jgi:hypothetical protein
MLADILKGLIPLAALSIGMATSSTRASMMAAGVLDQEHVVDYSSPGGTAWGLESPHDYAQTFTVGRSGELSRLELQIWGSNPPTPPPTEPVVARVHRTLGDGSPDLSPGAVLATVTFSSSEFTRSWFTGVFVGRDLGEQAFPVQAGDRLAIVVETARAYDPQYGTWHAWGTSDTQRQGPGVDYAGGINLNRVGASETFTAYPNKDAGFRTFVVVPEPTTLLAPVAAVLLLFRRARR